MSFDIPHFFRLLRMWIVHVNCVFSGSSDIISYTGEYPKNNVQSLIHKIITRIHISFRTQQTMNFSIPFPLFACRLTTSIFHSFKVRDTRHEAHTTQTELRMKYKNGRKRKSKSKTCFILQQNYIVNNRAKVRDQIGTKECLCEWTWVCTQYLYFIGSSFSTKTYWVGWMPNFMFIVHGFLFSVFWLLSVPLKTCDIFSVS